MTLYDRDGHELQGMLDKCGQIWCDICQVHATPKPTTAQEWDELTTLEKFSAQIRDHDKKIQDALLVPVLLVGQPATSWNLTCAWCGHNHTPCFLTPSIDNPCRLHIFDGQHLVCNPGAVND